MIYIYIEREKKKTVKLDSSRFGKNAFEGNRGGGSIKHAVIIKDSRKIM